LQVIPPNQLPEEVKQIELQNGDVATLHQAIETRVPEVNPDEDIIVYRYKVPCPVCNDEVLAHSYDGKYFSNIQVNCRYCGVFFKPVVKRF
jgi:hypothetical protein